METYLRDAIKVPFDSLYLDPNNPRLYPDEPPGYSDPVKLFEADLQEFLEKRVEDEFGVDELIQAIIGQGWLPIDAIVVWEHPDGSQRNVVLEGNRRTVALRRLRERLPKEKQKLERMQNRRVARHDVRAQEELVQQLERIIEDTATVTVLPLDAGDQDEMEHKLPRVLAVRHITSARGWGNYAEDLWLLQRYEQLFEDLVPGEDLRWEPRVTARIADEASISTVKAKRQLLAASAYSHFRAEFEDELPAGEEFAPSDYYLFENIVRKPWLREQFSLGQDDLNIPADREQVLFDWVFKLPRGRTAEDNDNVFYRHENVLVWEKLKRYDDRHGTAFAQRFDVDNHESAPRMREVEADYLAHMARKKPQDVLETLLAHLGAINEETIESEGLFLEEQLKRLDKRLQTLLRMISAAEAEAA